METIAVVLNVRTEHVEAFEAGFREHELPVWRDLRERGLLERRRSTGSTSRRGPVEGTQQYLISVIFTSDEGHHVHDAHPGFAAWNAIADTYQTGDAAGLRRRDDRRARRL